MKIPEFQPNSPKQQSSEAAAATGPRRETVGGVGGGPTAYRDAGSTTLPPGEAIQAVDAVEVSSLSLSLLGNSNTDARVETLEKSYRLGQYSVNAEELARNLIQNFLSDQDGLVAPRNPMSPEDI